MAAFVLAEGVALLKRAPVVYTTLLEGLPGAWTQTRERPDSWSRAEETTSTALPELLATFQKLRTHNLQTLDDWHITPEQLRQTGLHPEFGQVTLEHLLSTWVVHDLAHMKQMTGALATRYRDAVGPWNHANYLRILQDA